MNTNKNRTIARSIIIILRITVQRPHSQPVQEHHSSPLFSSSRYEYFIRARLYQLIINIPSGGIALPIPWIYQTIITDGHREDGCKCLLELDPTCGPLLSCTSRMGEI